MEMYQNIGNFIDNYGNPFFVGSLVEKKVLFLNKKARTLFDCNEETCDFEKIFHKTEERLESLIAKGLKSGKTSMFYNFIAITAEQEKIVVDFQFGFFNEAKTEMFLEIIPKNDTRLAMALHQIQHSPRAEAILHLDEDLTILECNEAFHKLFQSNQDTWQAVYRKQLAQGFHVDTRAELVAEIHENLRSNQNYTKNLTIDDTEGQEHWYCLELQKRELDNAGTKLMCSLVNIEKQVEMKENFDLLNQYLSVVQESTVDLLYRVDIATNTMYSYHEFQSITAGDRVIPDYVNTFLDKNTIHPDDKEIYLKGFRDFYENDLPCQEPVRFSLGGNPYKWYNITAKKIFDNAGNLTEVFGTLVNVDNEVNMKDQVSTLHKYFDVLNDISGESLFIYDIKTEKLRLGGLTEKELGLPTEVEDYPESIFDYIHPEDLELFKKFDGRALDSGDNRLEVRLKNVDGNYQWYELLSDIICDDDGNQTEIFGRIKNIQSKHKLETEMEEANNYLLVMQELSDDILYRIDVEKKTLVYTTKSSTGEILTNTFENYPQSTFDKNLMHPDDEKIILEQTDEWLSGNMQQYKLRMKLVTDEYEWYLDSAINIRDKDGRVTEIYGRLQNIHSETMMKKEVAEATQELSILSQYFSAMQTLSGESLYTINVDTKVMCIQGDIAQELGLNPVHTDYPDCVIERLHPEDVENYKDFSSKTWSGQNDEVKLRGRKTDGCYHWYRLTSRIIRDDTGKAIEILGIIRNIHAAETMQAEVSTLNQYVEAVQSLSGESLYYVDVKTRILRQKGEVALELGLPDEIPHYPEGAYPVIYPEHLEKFKIFTEDTLQGKPSSIQCKVLTATGDYLWYEMISMQIYNKTGEMVEIFGRMTNIDKEMTIKADYSALNQYFLAMQNLSQNILFHIDMKTKTFKHADKNAQGFGVPVVIPNFVDTFIKNGFVRPEDGEKYREYTEKLMSGENMEYEIQAAVDVGVYQWFYITSQFIYNEKGEPVEVFGMMENIQDKKDLEQKASHDLMTKVLNKVSFEEEAEDVMLKLYPDRNHALIFIDLDDFKGVNDKLGHSYGDILLTTVGKRLKRHVREGDLVGRIGGDEFAVLLCNIGDEQSVLDRTNTMLESVKRNFSHEGISVGIRASVGVAVYPQHGKNYKDLIGKSDMAVYESKRQGKNVVSMYSTQLEEY